MTFEDTDTLAPLTAAVDHGRPAWPSKPIAYPHDGPLDTMLNFTHEAALIAEDMDGLATLFRAHFEQEDGRIPAKLYGAFEVVAVCIESMAGRLRLIEEHARVKRDHLMKGGAR